MSEPTNLTPDQAHGDGPVTPNRSPAPEGPLNRRQAQNTLADRLKARREGSQTPQARAEPEGEGPQHSRPEPGPAVERSQKPSDQSEGPTEEHDSASQEQEGRDESDAVVLETLDQLAEYGLEPETIRGLKAKVKVNGEEHEVPIKEALENFQFNAAITQKSQDLAKKQRDYERRYNEQVQQAQQAINVAKQQAAALHQALSAELERPEFAQLKQAAAQGDGQAAQQWYTWQTHIEQRQEEVRKQFQQLQQYEQAQIQQVMQQRLESERQKLRDAVPDWGPEKKQAVLSVAEKLGYSEQELQQADARSILTALRIHELEKENAELKAARDKDSAQAKKIVETSSTRPSARRDQSAINKKQLTEAVNKIKTAKGRGARQAAADALALKLQQRRKKR